MDVIRALVALAYLGLTAALAGLIAGQVTGFGSLAALAPTAVAFARSLPLVGLAVALVLSVWGFWRLAVPA